MEKGRRGRGTSRGRAREEREDRKRRGERSRKKDCKEKILKKYQREEEGGR